MGERRAWGVGDWFVDLFSNTGGSADEAEIAARSWYRQAVTDGQIGDQELAVLGFLEREFSDAHDDYVAAADMVAEIASTVGAIAAAIVVVAVTGGAAGPGVAALLASQFGVSQAAVVATLATVAAGGAKVGVSAAIGEERYDIVQSGGKDFVVGGAEGVVTALSGGVAKSLQGAFTRLVGLRGPTLTTEMSLSVVQASGVGMRQLGRRFASSGMQAGIEGMLGGMVGEMALTAMDEATWSKSAWDTVVSFGQAALRGLALGGGTGFVTGGALGALAKVVGKTHAPRLQDQLQRAGLSADRLESLTVEQARVVGTVDDALRQGDVEGAAALWKRGAKQFDDETATSVRKGLFQSADDGLTSAKPKAANWPSLKASYIGRELDAVGTPQGYTIYHRNGVRILRRIQADDALFAPLRIDSDGIIRVGHPKSQRLSKPSRVKAAVKEHLDNVGINERPFGHEAHHLIPDEVVRKHPLLRLAYERGLFDHDTVENIQLLAMRRVKGADNPIPDKVPGLSKGLPRHQGPHPEYSRAVTSAADDALSELQSAGLCLPDIPDEALQQAAAEIQIRAREILQDWPKPHLE